MTELEKLKTNLTTLLARRAETDEAIAEHRALIRGVEHGIAVTKQQHGGMVRPKKRVVNKHASEIAKALIG